VTDATESKQPHNFTYFRGQKKLGIVPLYDPQRRAKGRLRKRRQRPKPAFRASLLSAMLGVTAKQKGEDFFIINASLAPALNNASEKCSA
jgi:hypothetical protein